MKGSKVMLSGILLRFKLLRGFYYVAFGDIRALWAAFQGSAQSYRCPLRVRWRPVAGREAEGDGAS